MEWEEPVVIELSSDPDAEGECVDGSSAEVALGCANGAAAFGNCSTGLIQ